MRTLLATLAAAGLTMAAPLALAVPASADAANPSYSGYQAEAWSTPVRIELFEPTIPIPVDPGKPELEVDLSYTRARGQTGQLDSRASWLWPGDGIGEGLPTFGSQLGLPASLTSGGYPEQVNASSPGQTADQRQEPFPGVAMRAQAGDTEAHAQAGGTTTGEVGEGADPDAADEECTTQLPSVPAVPGVSLPSLPGLALPSGVPVVSDLPCVVDGVVNGATGAVNGLSGATTTTPGTSGDSGSVAGIPPQLALLVSTSGLSSTSRITLDDDSVTTVARSALGEVSILGGLITMEGITSTSRAVSTTDGARSTGNAVVGAVYLAGQRLAFDDEGAVAAGQQTKVPGLPDQATQALKRLGISLSMPSASRSVTGRRGTTATEALRVEIDTVTLKSLLDLGPLETALASVTGMLPEQASQLGTLLDTVIHLAPKVVIRVGNASATTETTSPLTFATAGSTPDPAPAAPASSAPAAPADAGAAAPATAAGAGVPAAPADVAPAADTAGGLDDSQLAAGPGLPALTTVPGLLLWGGLAAGGLAGAWLRRIGLLALHGGASCPHGCDTGLPDLRKM